jgi:pimeloyl-ACP methyl ester carboxylesterase
VRSPTIFANPGMTGWRVRSAIVWSVSTTARRRKRLIPSRARPASLRAGRRATPDYGATAQPDWREVDFARARRTVQIDGRAVNVIDLGHGDGPPVVLVHGLGGSWKNWLENIPPSAQHRRTIALDLPGFGESELPAGEISISGYADTLEELCRRLDLGTIDLVGNSMGGFVASELAITRPERVRRLVLVDAAGISIADLRRRPTRTLMALVAVQSSWAPGQRMIMARPRLRHLAFRSIMRHPTRLALDLVAHQAGGPGMPGFLLALDALLSYDFRHRLGKIACPTLIVQGEDDMLVPLADAWEFRRLIPNSRLRVLQDTGHVAMLERPETFNRLLAEFLGLG